MDKEMLDLYTDYLLVSTAQTTATGMSNLLEDSISHDRITRFLSKDDFTSQTLWSLVKPTVRQIEQQVSIEDEQGVLILDDSVEEKIYTDENELIGWHYDHVQGRTVKGVNQLTALYHIGGMSLPVGLDFIKKDQWQVDQKTGKRKRVSSISKHERFQKMVANGCANLLSIKYILADKWFASSENLFFIKQVCHKAFVMPLKDNRKVALTLAHKQAGAYQRISELGLEADDALELYLEQLDFPVKVCRVSYPLKDGRVAESYLVTSELALETEEITCLYQRRWKVEEMYKSVKSNASYNKSPTRTIRTQQNHFFCAMIAFFKLELLRQQKQSNHFALKGKLYLAAIKQAYQQLKRLKTECNLQLAA